MFSTFQSGIKHHTCFTFASLLTACMLFCAVFIAGFSNNARAVTGSSDYTGLWWNAAESGWGMNVIQQEQIIFITLFIYGTGNAPTWYVGPATNFTTANAAGDRTYTGLLYATTGTPFATTPFVPGSVTVNQVGSVTFVGKADGTATLSYTVNGATVNKNIVRQTWAQPNFTLNTITNYVASNSDTTTGCTNPSDNGSGSGSNTNFGLYVNSVGNTLRFEITSPDAGLCTLFGNNYVQEGRYGRAIVTGRCTAFPASAPSVVFNVREFEVGPNFFTFQYTITGGPAAGCTSRGVYVGAKK
jgi:hypothetical protein